MPPGRGGVTSAEEAMTANLSMSASQLAQYDQARRTAALTGAARPTSPVTQPPPQVTAATAQAADGAAQAQPREEPFNAPMLVLPPEPTSHDVRLGLVRAMADPTVNHSTAQQLFQLHEQLMQAEKAMLQVIVDGMLM
jgi:hypothetical protein